MTQPSQQPPPPCFGHSWSSSAVECRGGKDEAYLNPRNNTNVRDQCRWYANCASRTSANSQAVRPPAPLIPTHRLAHPYPAPPPPVAPVQAGPGQPVRIQPPQPWYPPQQQYPQYQQQVPAPVPQQQHHGYYGTPHQAYYGPQYVPMPMQVPGAQMHGYLSVPEPVETTTSWIKRLFFEMIRAAFKGLLHQSAHVVDHVPFTRPQPPQPPQLPPQSQ